MHKLFGGFISTLLSVSDGLWPDAAEESRKLCLRYWERALGLARLGSSALGFTLETLTLLNMENQGNTNGPFIKYLKVHLGSHRDPE